VQSRGRSGAAAAARNRQRVEASQELRVEPTGTEDAESGSRRYAPPPIHRQPEAFMLYYAVVFLIIALVAALLGFGGIAAGAASIAKILFVVFLIVAIVTFLLSLGRR
jgi:uncharacterized membrane protein YtjA (UPF0391 family)